MAAMQAGLVGPLARRVRPTRQAGAGFVLMGLGVGALGVVRSVPAVLASLGVLASGTALVVPSLAALVATAGDGHFGAVLGLKSSASSLGQFLGPLAGGVLLAWRQASPYTLAALSMLTLGMFTSFASGRRAVEEQVPTE